MPDEPLPWVPLPCELVPWPELLADDWLSAVLLVPVLAAALEACRAW